MNPSFVSRRTWLWASATAWAAACARPEPSKLPDGGPEPARPLTRRGAENLTALAELAAAVRWLHPSDQVVETEWEPLLLDGVRGLEAAEGPVELLEGLRGLFVGVAPTLSIWRGGGVVEDDAALDLPACEEEPSDEEASEAEGEQAGDDRARSGDGGTRSTRPGPPARTAAPVEEVEASETGEGEGDETEGDETDEGETDEGETGEGDTDEGDTGEGETGEGETGEGETDEGDTDEGETDEGETDDTDETEPAEAPPAETPPAETPTTPSKPEPRPPLHAALFEQGGDLEITQWHRRGFSEGLDGQPGCAERIRRSTTSCGSAPHKRRREGESACSRCDVESHNAHAPGAPAQFDLPRALAVAMPVALWTRDGRTLPATPSLDPAPAFDERRAWDYDLADRGTRLLSVIRAHSLLRYFHAHRDRVQAPRDLLHNALCAVADDDSPVSLHEALERMLASFGDGNGGIQTEFGKAAGRWTPELSLRWIDERVVVGVTLSEHARAGDVITAIDGVAIDELLARELGRTAAARPGTAIERTAARLLARPRKGTTVEIDALRTINGEEQSVALQTITSRPAEHPAIADPRPSKPIVELREGLWYVDATRVGRLDALARRLRRATGVIVDLRGELADPSGSLCAHLIDAPLSVAHERTLAGPDEHGGLSLASIEDLELEPRRPRLSGRVVALADGRTRGRAEFELAGLERAGVTIVGSASAGDLGRVAQAWLPGGWRMTFTTSEVRLHDGSALWGRGVRPSVVVEETAASVRAGEDVLLRLAQSQFD